MSLIRLEEVYVIYGKKANRVQILKDVSFQVEEGELVAVMGKSGSGKTTLLNVLGTLLTPQAGVYWFDGASVFSKKERQRAAFRNRNMGFVVQHFALVADLTVMENIELPLTYQKVSKFERKQRVKRVMKELGIFEHRKKYPHQLSGGQNQRAAIARAMITRPKLILADEPTGALDSQTTKEIMQVFCKLNEQGTTILIVTHDEKVAQCCGRIIRIQDGKICEKSC